MLSTGSSFTDVASLGVLGLSGTFAFFLCRAIWVYLSDPLKLRHLPAPNLLAAISPLWCFRHSAKGDRYLAIHEAHKKLGGVVRIAPDHVSINLPEAVKEVYGHANASKVQKADFYDTLAGEYHNIANVRNREDHARKRKNISSAFAMSSILELEPAISGNVSLLLSKLDQFSGASTSNAVDINEWLSYFTFDVISQITVGESFGFLTQGSDAFRGQTKSGLPGTWHRVPSTIRSLRSAFHFKVALGQLSKYWYDFWTEVLWFSRGKKDVDSFTSVAIGQVRQRMEKDLEEAGEIPDFFSRLLRGRDGKSRNLPFMELVSEAIVFLNAGSDTTSSGLTSAIYEISRNPKVKERLFQELDEALGENVEVPSYDQVKDLPYLRACLDETLRLNPPISYGPPRLVIDPKGIDIATEHFRVGTTISIPTYTIQRNSKTFQDPDTFNPERWLSSDEDHMAEMRHLFIPFSTGPRSCLGRNLATTEQQIVLATLLHRYDIVLADSDFKPQRIEAFNYHPGALPVRLTRRLNQEKGYRS